MKVVRESPRTDTVYLYGTCLVDLVYPEAGMAGIEPFVELQGERECCGFGGTFSVRDPETSGAMANDRAADVAATGAREVLSGDCGRLLDISGTLEARGEQVRARHVAEFLMGADP
jgi:L-lactate dehydrogenase complex protein LldE